MASSRSRSTRSSTRTSRTSTRSGSSTSKRSNSGSSQRSSSTASTNVAGFTFTPNFTSPTNTWPNNNWTNTNPYAFAFAYNPAFFSAQPFNTNASQRTPSTGSGNRGRGSRTSTNPNTPWQNVTNSPFVPGQFGFYQNANQFPGQFPGQLSNQISNQISNQFGGQFQAPWGSNFIPGTTPFNANPGYNAGWSNNNNNANFPIGSFGFPGWTGPNASSTNFPGNVNPGGPTSPWSGSWNNPAFNVANLRTPISAATQRFGQSTTSARTSGRKSSRKAA